MGRDARPTPEEVPFADEAAGYVDFFSAEHPNREPQVLTDGTSVQWPSGWNEIDAYAWRKNHHLLWPGTVEAAREFFDEPDRPGTFIAVDFSPKQ